MRELIASNIAIHRNETIVTSEGTRGTETSNYPEEKKVNNDSESSGERNRRSPNHI